MPLAHARGSVSVVESTQSFQNRDRQGVVFGCFDPSELLDPQTG